MSDSTAELPPELRRKPATDATRRANHAVRDELDFDDRRDFELAQRGFLATLDPMTIVRERDGKTVFDLSRFDFLAGECPPEVNPSLWRQGQLNAQHHGLFEVVDGIYQARGFDLANMTLIRGNSGWIVVDPLTAAETSRAALDLANRTLGERPVRAVIHTHSHADHFGGVYGVTTPEAIAQGEVAVLAPRDFLEEALSENVLAGNVMNRRATFMFGNLLPDAADGFVGNGLGPALAMGSTGIAAPTDTIWETGETRTIDGVDFEFVWTPGTEAPTEMIFFLPQFKALCMAEIASHHLHNVYTPRGALTRDALEWSRQLQEAMDLFGDRLEVQFGCHHWPIWGRDEANEFLSLQRDLYKFIHDQTLRLANQGHTPEEIAERIQLPEEIGRPWCNRDYYGTVRHNARAVYNRYLGYFDGHPSNLDPLPQKQAAERYVAAIGGIERVVELGREAYDRGDYRWVAELVRHAVFADGDHMGARVLLADAFEQLGYRAESGPWRNFYLTGAQELRHGTPKGGEVKVSRNIARGMPMGDLCDAMAVRLHPEKANGVELDLVFEVTDEDGATRCTHRLRVARGVLHARLDAEPVAADDPSVSARVRCGEFALKRMLMGIATVTQLLEEGESVEIDGDPAALVQFAGLFDGFVRSFPILFARE